MVRIQSVLRECAVQAARTRAAQKLCARVL